jgi:hypothetical protein
MMCTKRGTMVVIVSCLRLSIPPRTPFTPLMPLKRLAPVTTLPAHEHDHE